MTRSPLPLCLLAQVAALSAGCLDQPPPSGTLVGNPGKTDARVAPIGGLDLATATAEGLAVRYVGCDGVAADAPEHPTSLVDGRFTLPGGSWCSLVAAIDTLHVTGTRQIEPIPVEISLDPGLVLTLWTTEPLVVDETDTILELGAPGWLAVDAIEPVEGGIVIAPESELASALALAIARDSAWYLDDGDGVLDEVERDAGPIATTVSLPPDALRADEDSGVDTSVGLEGCNCATETRGGGAAAGLLAALAALGLRRPAPTASRRTAGARPSARR